ncbi:MAG: Ni/Fe hydrogenase subunit alpha [Candidatus Hodarchaeales archaeon]|jgi:coenzyme F420-reducing hydrogenase alpha subunit
MTIRTIDLKHIARVEGYGRLIVDIEDKKLKKAEFRVLEGARFFEGITLGKRYNEIPIIISRICAICSASHSIVSTCAIEKALGITISEQTHKLRRLLIYGETIQSHVLHEYFLAIPDYLREPSAIAMASNHKNLVLRAFKSKKLGNEIQRKIGGRAVHPIRNVVGGFTRFPTLQEIETLQSQLPKLIEDTMDTIKIFRGLPDQPTINMKKNYVALHNPNTYEYYNSDFIGQGYGNPFPVQDYQKHLIEEIRPYSHTKFSNLNGESFMVGALARLNQNFNFLKPKAQEALELSGLELPDYDTYHINMAQLIETVDCAERIMDIFQYFLSNGFEEENLGELDYRPGNGIAATEAPRGLLIHQYTFDETLKCTYTDIITPTAFNQHKMETDCEDLIPRIADEPKEEIELKLNMLIRAYDPCISCSAHNMKVKVDFE